MTPQRIQLSRAKGFSLQAMSLALNGLPCVKVDRSTGWGNPWIAGSPGRVKLHSGEILQIGPTITTAGAVDRFRRWMRGEFGYQIGAWVKHPLFDAVLCPGAPPNAGFLHGQNLGCWCAAGSPCHADVLLDLASAPKITQEARDLPRAPS